MELMIDCERSQVVTKAFRDKGIKAWSCDIRSKTFEGIAEAMADQWGNV